MQSKTRILIIEDEPAIQTGLVDVFIYHGYQTETAADGNEGLKKALSGRYAMILLDVMLPGMNGFEICQHIRQKDRDVAIILLTAKTTDEDIIEGFSLGADDYVGKPFSVAQLVLRVQAVLRRSTLPTATENQIRLSETVLIDCNNLCGQCSHQQINFTRREIDLLQYLKTNTHRPVSRDELLSKVWGYGNHLHLETRTVDIHIAKLRRKIEPDPARPRFLVTIRGAGYRLIIKASEHD
ncbi:MAG TPA: response regulator transcription factor [Crenotrichaceae bacterium]|nr:response regulator transcription factor [Crenotrichaceae bacterium]